MYRARDFKAWAKDVLRGHWGTAVAVCLVASLLGGGGVPVPNSSGAQDSGASMMDVAGVWPVVLTAALILLIASMVIGGAVSMGMSHYFTNLSAHRPSKFTDLFARFRIWHKGIGMSLVTAFFVFLWTLPGLIIAGVVSMLWLMNTDFVAGSMIIMVVLFYLGSIPAIIAMYRYAMMPYLLAEFPDLTVMDAMRESKRLMQGNKYRLFCLGLSFWAWHILACLTLLIGYLWLTPYINASRAAFYLDVTGRSGLRHEQPEE